MRVGLAASLRVPIGGPPLDPDADPESPYARERDLWGQPYRLMREEPRVFQICSYGPDTEPDTEDDIGYPEAAPD